MEPVMSARTPRPQFSAKNQTESWGLPTTSMGQSILNRPITQHGVEGMPQTANSRKRIFYDKRYYITSIQSHMNKIRDEINELYAKTNKQKPTSASLNNDRKTAKEEAKVYENYQRQLSVLNITLEMHLSRIGNEETIAETASVNKKNSTMFEELDRLFLQKTRCEDTNKKVKEDLKLEEQKIRDQISKLPAQEIDEYNQLSKANQMKLKEISKVQAEIKEIKGGISKIKDRFSYNGKQQKLKLLTEFHSKNEHKNTLQGHLEAVPVEKERELLLNQVKNDKADIDALQKVRVSLEEQLNEKKNQLSGLEQELDSKNSQRLKKYRDVHTRHAQVNSYIEAYGEVSTGVLATLNRRESSIIKGLDYLLDKSPDVNFEEIDKLQTSSDNANDYKILISRLSKLNGIKQKFEDESKLLEEKRATMTCEMETFKNADVKISELTDQIKQSDEKQKSIKSILKVTTSAVKDAKKRLLEFEQALEKNDTYHEVVALGKELEQLENTNERLKEDIKLEKSNEEFSNVMNEVNDLLKTKNENIIERLKAKNMNKGIN